MRARLLLTALLATFFAMGCTQILPPVATPAAVPPEMQGSPPIEPGAQRLVLDVVDGPTDVFELTAYRVRVRTRRGRLRLRTRTQRDLLCRTPCAVDLPHGRYVLGFPMHGGDRLEREEIHLGPQPLVHRRALGSYQGAGPGLPLGVVGATFGGIAMVLGVVFLPVGLAAADDGVAIAGGINLGVGAALLTAGILGIALDPDVVQPGSGITFAM